MTAQESLRMECLRLAINDGEWKPPYRGLRALETAIGDYIAGKDDADIARIVEPEKLPPEQEAAVRMIVAEMLATMLEGTDDRIREAMRDANQRSDNLLSSIARRVTCVEESSAQTSWPGYEPLQDDPARQPPEERPA